MIDDLESVGVRRLVVHRAELEPRRLAEIEALARAGARIRFQGRFNDDDLYEIIATWSRSTERTYPDTTRSP